MEKWPNFKITVSSSEKTEKEFSLEDAARMAMNKKGSSKKNMEEFLAEVSNITGWSASEIGKTLANWNKPKSEPESIKDREKRAIESGDAWADEGERVRYYDDRENENK